MNFKKLHLIFLLTIALFGCRTMAQKSGQSQNAPFTDKEIENFVPEFEIEIKSTDYAPVVISKKDCTKPLPPSYSVRAAVICDSITETNKKIKLAKGYRILVYAGNNKEEANNIKANTYRILPDIDIITEFKQPNYRIKVGDFTSRLEANRILNQKISRSFPNAIVIEDNINIKRR